MSSTNGQPQSSDRRHPTGPVVPSRHSTQSSNKVNKHGSTSLSRPSTQKTISSPLANSSLSELFGKTSGWYHGSKFDIEELIHAAERKNNDTLKRCLKAGLNVNYCRWTKGDKVLGDGARSIADIVACRKDVNAMRLLIEHGVDLSGQPGATFSESDKTQERFRFLFPADERKAVEKGVWTTPLHLACKLGYLEMVRVLLEEGHLDPNTEDCQGKVGLHMIGGAVPDDIAKLLIGMGARVDYEDFSGASPLAIAALHGKNDLVNLLIDYGAFIDSVDKYGETAIFNASLREQNSTVSVLVSRGGDVNARNVKGDSAFFRAASRLRTEIMNVLSNCGCDVDTRDNNGCTPLLRAVMARNITLVNSLLGLGVNINTKDNDGWTPLFASMILKDEGLVQLLLQTGSDVELRDHHGNTALHQAAITGSTSVSRHMLSRAPHTYTNGHNNSANLLGETALSLACSHNSSSIVRLLLQHNADYSHVDPNGHRALDRAMYWGNFACARLILEAGSGLDSKSLLALQQGKLDGNIGPEAYDTIINYLRPRYKNLTLPNASPTSMLRELFAQFPLSGSIASMRKKQGKLGESAENTSSDPFEACIPESPLAKIINNHTTNIHAGGVSALEVGAAGTSLALGVTSAILGL